MKPFGGGGITASAPSVFSSFTWGGHSGICQIWFRMNASVTSRVSVKPSLTMVDLPFSSRPATTRRARTSSNFPAMSCPFDKTADIAAARTAGVSNDSISSSIVLAITAQG